MDHNNSYIQSSCSSNGSRKFFDAGPKAVYIEYVVIPKSKLDTKITIIVAVSILYNCLINYFNII